MLSSAPTVVQDAALIRHVPLVQLVLAQIIIGETERERWMRYAKLAVSESLTHVWWGVLWPALDLALLSSQSVGAGKDADAVL